MAVFHTALNTLTSRSYAGCAWNSHAIIKRQSSTAFYQVGGQTAPCCNGFLSTIDVATNPAMTFSYENTFTPSNFSWAWAGNFSGANPTSRVAPLTVVVVSGALIVGGGKTAPNWAFGNDVVLSSDGGQSWSLSCAAAPWSARSDGSAAVAPGTSVIVYAGGQGSAPGIPQRRRDADTRTTTPPYHTCTHHLSMADSSPSPSSLCLPCLPSLSPCVLW